ncbi:MAG: hypothetical protein ACR2H5_26030 [Ktedonobacteraceae bacterium]
MKWQQPQDNSYGNMDEHNAPTEPMMPIYPSPSAFTVPNDAPTVDGQGIPMPIPHERPFPYQDMQQNVAPAPFVVPAAPVYPVLPPALKNAKKGKRPAGGAVPAYPVQPADANKPASQTQHRPSAFPALVGLFFVLVQLLLLVRFVLRLLNLSGNVPWTGIIYAISGIFVLPFRLLLANINFPIPNTLEIYTLIAILVYGLLSRLIVRLLKAILR